MSPQATLVVTLAVIGIVIILLIYIISKIMERNSAKDKARHLKKPPGRNRFKSPFGSRKKSSPSASPGMDRSSQNEPNFSEDDLTYLTETDVLFGVSPDGNDHRRPGPDEIENLTGPDSADSIPVLSDTDVVGQYQADKHDKSGHDSGNGQSDSGDGRTETPIPGQESEEVEADDARDIVDQGDSHGPKDSDSQREGSSSQFQYPKIEGFVRVSQIDYWIKLIGKRDVGRESVLAQYRDGASLITKRHQIFGQKIPQREWCVLEQETESGRFGDLIITLQLADKNGAVSQEDLDRFITMAEKLAKGVGYDFTLMAPVESALKQGEAIADFIRHYESVSVIHVKPVVSKYFDGLTINRCASQLGFERSPEGFFVRNQLVNKKKINLYYLANMSKTGEFDFDNMKEMQIRGVTFFTKPVLNRSPGVVFAEMSDTAKACAARIKGNAAVPNHHTLSQRYVDQNRASIEKIAREMEDLGIASGSEEAMRLF